MNNGWIERLAYVVGRLGFHGAIGISAIGAVVFVVIYGAIYAGGDDPQNPTLLGALARDAFVVISVGVGGLLTVAVNFFKRDGGS